MINLIFWRSHYKSYKKASQKLHALPRIANYMDLPKRNDLMKGFITSQFSYCPLIWMLNSMTLNKIIDNIRERALRQTYKDNQFSFKKLLEKDHYLTVPHKNLQVLVKEIFKFRSDLVLQHHEGCIWVKRPSIQPTIWINSLYTPKFTTY